MYEMFASWYSEIWPPDPRRLRDRWLAVESVVASLSPETALDCAALAFSCDVNSHTREVIREAAKRFDPGYVPSKDEHELSLLASGVLVRGLCGRSAMSDLLALAFICVQFGRSTTTPIQRHLAAICQKYLSDRVVSDREGEAATPITTHELNEVDLPSDRKELIRKLRATHEMDRQHLETLLLATCRYSTLIDRPFRALRKAEAVFLAAYELAVVSRFSLGMSAHSAVLDNLIREANGRESLLSIGDAVKAAPRELERGTTRWARMLPHLFPCQFGIALWSQTNDDELWKEQFLRSTSLNPEARYPLLQLARQSYFEQLLCGTLAGLQKRESDSRVVSTSVRSTDLVGLAETSIATTG